jgi:hypothetical protein
LVSLLWWQNVVFSNKNMGTQPKKPIPLTGLLGSDEDTGTQMFLGEFAARQELQNNPVPFQILHKPICQYCQNVEWDGKCLYCRPSRRAS